MKSFLTSLLVIVSTVLFSCLVLNSSANADQPLLCTKGKVIFEETFSTDKVDARWSAAKGQWKIVDGALKGTEIESDNHAASIRTDTQLPGTSVVAFDFKFDGGKIIHCSFNGKGHICRATITPNGFTLKGEKVKKDPADKSVTVGQVQQKFESGQWYTMQIEMAGKEFLARVGDGPVAFGSHEKVDRPKSNFGFPMAGVSSHIDNIKIWNAELNPNWEQVKSKLPVNKIVPPALKTAKERFQALDKNQDSSLSLKEFIGNRAEEKHELATKQFRRLDKDESGSLDKTEFPPKRPGSKKK